MTNFFCKVDKMATWRSMTLPTSSECTQQGVLVKKGRGFGSLTEKKYYCMIQHGKLSMYKESDKLNATRCIELSLAQSVRAGKGSTFEIVTRTESHIFNATSVDCRDKWVKALQEGMRVSMSSSKNVYTNHMSISNNCDSSKANGYPNRESSSKLIEINLGSRSTVACPTSPGTGRPMTSTTDSVCDNSSYANWTHVKMMIDQNNQNAANLSLKQTELESNATKSDLKNAAKSDSNAAKSDSTAIDPGLSSPVTVCEEYSTARDIRNSDLLYCEIPNNFDGNVHEKDRKASETPPVYEEVSVIRTSRVRPISQLPPGTSVIMPPLEEETEEPSKQNIEGNSETDQSNESSSASGSGKDFNSQSHCENHENEKIYDDVGVGSDRDKRSTFADSVQITQSSSSYELSDEVFADQKSERNPEVGSDPSSHHSPLLRRKPSVAISRGDTATERPVDDTTDEHVPDPCSIQELVIDITKEPIPNLPNSCSATGTKTAFDEIRSLVGSKEKFERSGGEKSGTAICELKDFLGKLDSK